MGPGTELDGFVIEGVAGRGGMGVVYIARQRQPARRVAIKVIAAELANDPAFRARFQRESSIAAQIEHPNVIPVHAVGEANGVLYIAMRFVDGTDLRGMLATEGRLAPLRAATIVSQVAQALDAAHASGLVHRDVKPANILVSATGAGEHVYLSDFGLSRHIEGSQGLTGTGAFLGTIDYVAPEQARGERVDARTDVYSLGCVLFQVLTGTVPFPLDNDIAKLYAHDAQPPPSVLQRAEQLPAAFESVLQRAMAKAPEDRYLSAGDLGRAAVAAASDEVLSRAERSVAVGGAAPTMANPVPARPGAGARSGSGDHGGDATTPHTTRVGPPSPADRPAIPMGLHERRHWRGILVAATAVVVVVAIVLVSGGRTNSTPRPHDTPPTRAVQTAAVGIVPGRSIGSVALGEPRRQATTELVNAGYRAKPGNGASETDFIGNRGAMLVVGFDRGRAVYIQKYNDPQVTIGGVSINSTPRVAASALPSWRSLACPKAGYTFLVAPGGHTYFELAQRPNIGNPSGANGIALSAGAVTSCS